MICQICEKDFKNNVFALHIKKYHNIDAKLYYDTYLEPNTVHNCLRCNEPTKFVNVFVGYRHYCSQYCSRIATLEKTKKKYGVTNISQIDFVKDKCKKSIKQNWDNLSEEEYKQRCENISIGTKTNIDNSLSKLVKDRKEFAIKNNLVGLKELLNIYGTGFIQSNLFNLEIIIYKHKRFIKLEDIKYFEEYNKVSSIERTKQTNFKRYGVESPIQNEDILNKIKQTNLERYDSENVYASDQVKDKIKQIKLDRYANEYYNNREKANNTCLERYNENSYVETDDFKEKCLMTKKELYLETRSFSKYESNLVKFIEEFYDFEIIQNRKICDKYFLDIYLPKLNLAIEYNGTYWHSYPRKEKDYHLKKSLQCRKKKIRLIHIYEFEDFDRQKQLLKNLILGQDNYPNNDFNKNNLINNIPEPEVIYQNDKYIIYGSGKLFI